MARKSGFRKVKETLLLVVEGQTEKIYFNQMRSVLRLSNVSVEPKLSPKNDPFNILETAIKEMKEANYQHVWCIFDLDTFTNNPQKYNDIVNKARKKNIFIADSRPCFEIWFLLHYRYSTASYDSSQKVIQELKSFISDYCKKQDWIQKKNIYKILEPKLVSAIGNSKKLEEYNIINSVEDGSMCNIYKIFELVNTINKP